MTKTIVVVGSSIIDLTTYSPRLPRPGETLIGTKYEQNFGGKGANQCVTAARLGASTIFITSFGSDSLGEVYFEKLKNENIDMSYAKIKNNSHTGVAQIIVTDTGENSIVVVQGSNLLLSTKDVMEAKQKIQSASVLLCQFEVSLKSTLEALRIYKGHGISIVNGAPAVSSIDPDILKLSDIFCVNEVEAEIITGILNLKITNAQEAIDKLFSLGCNTIIITFGAQGAVHATQNKKKLVHTPTEVLKAVDTTGAGDAFLGALAYYLAYHSNLSLEECIRRSNKIAGQSVLKAGTQNSLPYRKDLPIEMF